MTDLISKEEFLQIVKEKLKTQTPFAFTRYSDGEIMLLNRHEYYEEYQRIVGKLWGYRLDEQQLGEVSLSLIKALRESDVVGFPTERHLRREDYFSKSKEVFEQRVNKLENCNLTSVDVAYELLYDNKYDDLLMNRETLNYISCRDLNETFKRRYNIKNINRFLIAPEQKFTSGYEGERHYPGQFNKIYDWIKILNCKGELCLVGGGVFSKAYNIWFKEKGGISLDIGAVFDLFAGYSTRGKNRGIDVEDLTYKL